MKEPERQQNRSAENARQHVESDVNTVADVEGAAAAMHESERRSPVEIASQARAAQETKAVAEGKAGDKDTPPAPPKRPGNFSGEDVKLTTDTPPPSGRGPAGDGGHSETLDDTQERSDAMASEVHPENEYRDEQEREQAVEDNINTDPAALEETGEVYSPPGPSISHKEKTQL